MGRKWNLVVDVSRCDNCRNCFLATKDEHIGNDFPGYAAAQPERGHHWVDIQAQERGEYPIIEANFMPVMCNHCDRAPCMAAARGEAVRKREDGIVIIDPQKARGQKDIVDACPYGAIYWNESAQIPQAWIFDAHLLDQGWQKPRVQSVCPNEVFRSLKLEDAEMQSIVAEEGLEVLQPELGTRPRVYYKHLYLMKGCFVGGTAVTEKDGIEDCVAGAEVVLTQQGRQVAQTRTDIFGEFKIDQLEPRSGSYELQVSDGTAPGVSMTFELGEKSLYLGKMRLHSGS